MSGARPMIEARGLVKRFGAVTAVDDVSFTVREGEIVGFLGPNGAGKTTTLRMLAGIFPPTTGTVRIAGHDPLTDPLACRRAVGYFPEHAPYYPELRVDAYLRFVATLKHVPRRARGEAVARALAACSLEAVAHRRIGTLSKGFRQRVGLAQALCGDPPVLILDEPTIGLDPAQVVDIRERVAGLRGRRTVLFSSHILSEVESLCERVVVVAKGRIVGEGTPAALSERLGRRRRVVVRLDGAPAAAREALGALPGAAAVTARDGALVVDAVGDADLVAAVGALAAARGWPLRELREETLDLEDIFLALVGDRR